MRSSSAETAAMTKKKFGKNLNKLVKQPVAPPIVNRSTASNRNGLLLLSTKKGSGMLSKTSTTTTTTTGGATSIKSNLDTNQGGEIEAARDVWGVQAQQQQQPPQPQADNQENKGEVLEERNLTEQQQLSNNNMIVNNSHWDEYGGRGDSEGARAIVGVDNGDEEQGLAMARLARERADRLRAQEEMRIAEQKERAAQRLRELDERVAARHDVEPAATTTTTNTPPRSRWDMTRSGTRKLWEPDQRDEERQVHEMERPLEKAPNSPLINRGPAADGTAHSSSPMIHVSSYEDRDRGERNNNAGPRMLFDPKSGSMVAVKAREESSNNKRNSNKAAAKKTRKERETKSDTSEGKSSPPEILKTARKIKRGDDVYKEEQNPGTAADKSVNPSRRLPRTCGVLYKRDDKGNYYCADECDGDLGYGAHSVPGGRTRNPDAYSEYVKQHQQLFNKDGTPHTNAFGHLYDDSKYSTEGGGDIALYTGFNPDEDMQLEPVEYVRAGDKLELLGDDDSPTLKPTAKEWAPSATALAAARAAAQRATTEPRVESSEDEEDVEEDDDEGPIGLGFDPTIDMDFVMQSPSHDGPGSRLESFNISALDLEPPVYPTNSNSGPRHIFAFGSSGTWGLSQPAVDENGDWKVPSMDGGGLFGAGAFRAVNDITDEPSSFLNIPTGSSWGAPTLGGVSTTPSAGEGSRTSTTGD